MKVRLHFTGNNISIGTTWWNCELRRLTCGCIATTLVLGYNDGNASSDHVLYKHCPLGHLATYPLVWAAIIAASQVLDALKDVFPVSKRYIASSDLTVALDRLSIDTQMEWENVFSGTYAGGQINMRMHKLRKLQHDAECHSFPSGLPKKDTLFERAEADARLFFATAYNVKSQVHGGL